MLPLTGWHRMRHGFCPVDLAHWRPAGSRKAKLGSLPVFPVPPLSVRSFAVLVASMAVLGLNPACGPSNEEVTRAAEESISRITLVAVSNLKCSVSESLSAGTVGAQAAATETMERFSDRLAELTDALENDRTASNREKMRVIGQMDELRVDWEEELGNIGCEIPES